MRLSGGGGGATEDILVLKLLQRNLIDWQKKKRVNREEYLIIDRVKGEAMSDHNQSIRTLEHGRRKGVGGNGKIGGEREEEAEDGELTTVALDTARASGFHMVVRWSLKAVTIQRQWRVA